MRGRTIVAIASALALSVPSLGYAQNRGTQAEQDACTPDVFSLCEELIPNEGPIVACLKAKRRQLSPACSLVMFPQQSPASKHARVHHKGKKHHSRPK